MKSVHQRSNSSVENRKKEKKEKGNMKTNTIECMRRAGVIKQRNKKQKER